MEEIVFKVASTTGPVNCALPCTVNEEVLMGKGSKGGQLIGFPQEGHGDRSLFCDQYERCLDLACQRQWPGFNCQCCSYENRGELNFRLEEFCGLDEADDLEELLYCSEGEMDALLGITNNQEDYLITLIDGKAGDER